MSSEVVKAGGAAAAIETVLIKGDLAALTADQRLAYYKAVCESVGLNPLTQPFQYLTLSGKLVLYTRRDATEQLRRIHKVSVTKLEREVVEGVYVVTATATTADGRTDQSIGAVALAGLKGESLANAYMKAETKAKRRVTLSICGLGLLDESEVPSTPDAPTLPAPTAKRATAEQVKEIEAHFRRLKWTIADVRDELANYLPDAQRHKLAAALLTEQAASELLHELVELAPGEVPNDPAEAEERAGMKEG